MKKIFMFLVTFATIVCVSCSDDDNDTDDPNNPGKYFQSGTIKVGLDRDIDELYVYSHHEGETIDIDWGDGRSSSYITVCADDEDWGTIYDAGEIKHDYSFYYEYSSYNEPYMATIKGNIQILICNDDVKFIDARQCPQVQVLWFESGIDSLLNVNGCSALRELNCEKGDLTTLDLSGCTALSYLDCSYNELTSLSLPENSSLKYVDISDNELDDNALNAIYHSLPTDTEGTIYIRKNPGKGNRSIAEQKGWKVNDTH